MWNKSSLLHLFLHICRQGCDNQLFKRTTAKILLSRLLISLQNALCAYSIMLMEGKLAPLLLRLLWYFVSYVFLYFFGYLKMHSSLDFILSWCGDLACLLTQHRCKEDVERFSTHWVKKKITPMCIQSPMTIVVEQMRNIDFWFEYIKVFSFCYI